MLHLVYLITKRQFPERPSLPGLKLHLIYHRRVPACPALRCVAEWALGRSPTTKAREGTAIWAYLNCADSSSFHCTLAEPIKHVGGTTRSYASACMNWPNVGDLRYF